MGTIESAVAAFSFGRLQDAATLIRTLEANGIDRDEFLEYVDGEKERRFKMTEKARERRAAVKRRLPKCPSCGIPMVLRMAHPPDRATGDPGDPSEGSHWTCPECRFGRYDPRTIQEVQKSIDTGVGSRT